MNHAIDHVLTWLNETNGSATLPVDEYCQLNYSMSWEELQHTESAEWYAEVLDLIESGELKTELPMTEGRQ